MVNQKTVMAGAVVGAGVYLARATNAAELVGMGNRANEVHALVIGILAAGVVMYM